MPVRTTYSTRTALADILDALSPLPSLATGATIEGAKEEIVNELRAAQEWDLELTDEVTRGLEALRAGNKEASNEIASKLGAIYEWDKIASNLRALQEEGIISELQALRTVNAVLEEVNEELKRTRRGHEMFLWEEEVD